MIINFESYTEQLSKDEISLLPLMIKGFKKHDISNPIKADDIIDKMNEFLAGRNAKRLTGARLRKIVNFIRCEGILPLVATSNGYYVSYDKFEIEKQIESLHQRAAGINKAAEGLQNFLNKI
jgi:hypothetical protein